MTSIDQYLEQAALSGKLAEQAALPRQREMYLRAQAKWQELADQAIITNRTRWAQDQ
jgi:hypothetical protein